MEDIFSKVQVIYAHVPIPASYRPPMGKFNSSGKSDLRLTGKLDTSLQCVIEIILNSNGVRSRPLRALIDTGAFFNIISKDSIDDAYESIKGQSVKYKFGGNEIYESELHYCEVEAPFLNPHTNFQFVKSQETIAGFDALLGVMFLSSCVFKYNHPEQGQFTLEPI